MDAMLEMILTLIQNLGVPVSSLSFLKEKGMLMLHWSENTTNWVGKPVSIADLMELRLHRLD